MIKTPLSTVLGGVFWTPGATVIGGNTPTFEQRMKKLFANGEQGFWYDPNDLSTMFQDAAGTVPVTAVGQPVGLMLDKSKGLALGADIVINGDFSAGATGWSTTGTVTISGGLANFNNEANASNVLQATPSIVVGRLYKVTYTVTAISGGSVSCGMGSSFGAIRTTSGTYTEYLFAASTNIYIRARTSGTTATIDNISVKELAGNHAYQTTSASRPILRQNALTGANYLEFDGSDDFLQTSDIDFTSTDKVSLFAGVQKMSDVNVGSVFCLSSAPTSVSGVFEMYTPQVAGGEGAAYYSRGVSIKSSVVTQGLKSPASFILSAKTDIANDTVICKINQSSAAATGNLGGGNFSNNPLFIGRRGGTAFPFNGHIYGLIGVGRLTTDAETTAIEKELAKRTGVTLNV